jgi:hypothetical protein
MAELGRIDKLTIPDFVDPVGGALTKAGVVQPHVQVFSDAELVALRVKVEGGSAIENSVAHRLIATTEDITNEFLNAVRGIEEKAGSGSVIDKTLGVDLAEWNRIAASINKGSMPSNQEARAMFDVLDQVRHRADQMKVVLGRFLQQETRALPTDTERVRVGKLTPIPSPFATEGERNF